VVGPVTTVSTPTGVCRGCGVEKRLRPDGTLPPHPLPVHLRIEPYESCPGGELAPERPEIPVKLEPVVAAAPPVPAATLAVVEDLKRFVDATDAELTKAATTVIRARTRNGRIPQAVAP